MLPGAFNHVIAGGIPKRIFFRDDSDRSNFLGRLVTIVGEQTSAALQGVASCSLLRNGNSVLIFSCAKNGVARVAASHDDLGADLSGNRHRRCRRDCDDGDRTGVVLHDSAYHRNDRCQRHPD
jgi:hypothetical protein